VNRVRLGTKQH